MNPLTSSKEHRPFISSLSSKPNLKPYITSCCHGHQWSSIALVVVIAAFSASVDNSLCHFSLHYLHLFLSQSSFSSPFLSPSLLPLSLYLPLRPLAQLLSSHLSLSLSLYLYIPLWISLSLSSFQCLSCYLLVSLPHPTFLSLCSPFVSLCLFPSHSLVRSHIYNHSSLSLLSFFISVSLLVSFSLFSTLFPNFLSLPLCLIIYAFLCDFFAS